MAIAKSAARSAVCRPHSPVADSTLEWQSFKITDASATKSPSLRQALPAAPLYGPATQGQLAAAKGCALEQAPRHRATAQAAWVTSLLGRVVGLLPVLIPAQRLGFMSGWQCGSDDDVLHRLV